VLIERSFDWYNFNDIWSGRMAPAIFITDDGGVESQMVHGLWHCPLMLHSKEKSFKKRKSNFALTICNTSKVVLATRIIDKNMQKRYILTTNNRGQLRSLVDGCWVPSWSDISSSDWFPPAISWCSWARGVDKPALGKKSKIKKWKFKHADNKKLKMVNK
jgi:hypothetical protein